MVSGDWEDVQVYLGLLDERTTPAPDYAAIEMPEILELRRTLDGFAQRSEEHKPSAKPKLGRNDPCWCGSGKKYKYCHLRKDRERK
jgi:preprotein translocase subunit SecA